VLLDSLDAVDVWLLTREFNRCKPNLFYRVSSMRLALIYQYELKSSQCTGAEGGEYKRKPLLYKGLRPRFTQAW